MSNQNLNNRQARWALYSIGKREEKEITRRELF